MSWDMVSALIGLAAGCAPLLGWVWYQQRQVSAALNQQMLAQERLQHAQQQLQFTGRALEEAQLEVANLGERHSTQMARMSSQSRELELLHDDLEHHRQQLEQMRTEREQRAREWAELNAERATLAGALKDQELNHQQRINDLQNARDELRAQFGELATRIFDEREQRFTATSQAQLGQLLDPLKERIQAFEQRVEQSYTAEARERFSLAKELERLQSLNVRLTDEAQHLTQALRGQKTQGNWGELVLERVLESAGLLRGREYQTQVSLKSPEGERFQPDVLLYLPGERQVVIDSKVSLNAYQQAVAATVEDLRQAALKQHVVSLRNHVKGLAVKDYQRLEGLNSLDLVLLFVPIEAAFAAALQTEPELFQEAFAQHIVIVSPTTLLATLRVIESLWRQERQGQNAREIAERAGALYDKFVAFVADLDEVGSRIQQLDKAYSGARNKLLEGRGNIVGRIENLKLLGARASKRLPDALLEQAGEAQALDRENDEFA